MNLAELFNRSNIRCVHIVDDAFDDAPTVGFNPDVAQGLVEVLSDSQFDELCKFLGNPEMNDVELVTALTDAEQAAKIFRHKDRFGEHVENVFKEFVTHRNGKLVKITPLVDLLESLGVACLKFGSSYSVQGSEEPQLIFIDLMLNEGEITVDDAVNVYGKLVSVHNNIKPFIYLMSSLSRSTFMQRRDEFRLKAKLFASQFEAVEKNIFSDATELNSLLIQCARFLPELIALHERVNSVETAINKAAANVRETLRNMDIADYFVLHHNTVSIENVKLGTYISDLLLEYLVQEVESCHELWEFASLMDSWKLEQLPRSRFGLTYAAGKIYSGNLLHSKARLESECIRLQGPEHGYFYLGDIFLKTSELGNKPKQALVIATPACDLVRPENLKDRTILLCEGRVNAVSLATVPAGRGGISTTIIPHPHDEKKQLAITWEKKKFRTWDLVDLEKFKTGVSEWSRVGRLRPLYAIQLQHAITADLSRIGVQRPPNMLIPCGVEVFVTNGITWSLLDSDDVREPTAAAYSDTEDGKGSLFIISDPTVRRIVKKLNAWLGRNSEAVTAAKATTVLAIQNLEQKLMFHAYRISDHETLLEIPGHPLSGSEAEMTHAITILRPNSSTCYDGVNGGVEVSAEQKSLMVIKLKRVSH
ncbi:hypothetical protein [Pseudomonas helleri]|uniref:Uncharacterized protein n=1 Tax=Pseudomonas helleri TaxID=1608996 RepID=A0A7X2BW36_9PSED|nr:hypothetical protein [Pseudomonas helleri]MQT77259.1 hypothetical protein [Pseudomonas helleri]